MNSINHEQQEMSQISKNNAVIFFIQFFVVENIKFFAENYRLVSMITRTTFFFIKIPSQKSVQKEEILFYMFYVINTFLNFNFILTYLDLYNSHHIILSLFYKQVSCL